ncbi:hypothetical protein ACLOJK_014566 [Asimina triloba]
MKISEQPASRSSKAVDSDLHQQPRLHPSGHQQNSIQTWHRHGQQHQRLTEIPNSGATQQSTTSHGPPKWTDSISHPFLPKNSAAAKCFSTQQIAIHVLLKHDSKHHPTCSSSE